MASRISKLAVAAILATSTSFAAAQSGSGHTTRYW